MTTINYLTTIQFDFGALRLLTPEAQKLGIRRPLIVTDRGVRAAGLLERLTGVLGSPTAPLVFDETPPNPTEDAVIAATCLYRDNDCDGIFAIGGGSSFRIVVMVSAVVGF